MAFVDMMVLGLGCLIIANVVISYVAKSELQVFSNAELDTELTQAFIVYDVFTDVYTAHNVVLEADGGIMSAQRVVIKMFDVEKPQQPWHLELTGISGLFAPIADPNWKRIHDKLEEDGPRFWNASIRGGLYDNEYSVEAELSSKGLIKMGLRGGMLIPDDVLRRPRDYSYKELRFKYLAADIQAKPMIDAVILTAAEKEKMSEDQAWSFVDAYFERLSAWQSNAYFWLLPVNDKDISALKRFVINGERLSVAFLPKKPFDFSKMTYGTFLNSRFWKLFDVRFRN